MKNSEKPKMTESLQKKVDDFLKRKLSLRNSVEAEEILTEMVNNNWSTRDMARVLHSQSIYQAMSSYGISKPLLPRKSGYSDEQDGNIKEYYDRPKDSDEESARLRQEMLDKVNSQRAEEGLLPVTLQGIRIHVGEKYHWPWRKDQRPAQEITGRAKELEGELQEQIHGGALVDQNIRIDGLFKNFCQKISDEETPPEFLTSKSKFEDKVADSVWTKKTLTALEEIVEHDVQIEEFCKYYAYIPLEMVKEKAEWLRGVSNILHPVTFLKGIGRLGGKNEMSGEQVKLPKASFNHPYESGIQGDKWSLELLNGANIGLKHPRLIQYNPVRCALADGRRNSDKLLILSNILDLEFVEGASPQQVYRSVMSGLKPKVALLEQSYQKEANRILKNEPFDEMVYTTAAEEFANVLSGWSKICTQPDGDPEFPGPILIILGAKEERLVARATAWEYRYFTILKQKKLGARITAATNALADARSEGDRAEVTRLKRELERLVRQHSRTRVSNVAAKERLRYRNYVRSIVIKKIEEAIPGSKVISMGSTYVQLGEEKVLFFVPSRTNVTDTTLANFTKHYAPRVLKGTIPDMVVICHPHSVNRRMTVRDYSDAGGRKSVQIEVAPICVDDKFLREALEDNISNPHPIAQAVNRWDFRPGVLRLRRANNIISVDDISVESLINIERRVTVSKNKSLEDAKYPNWRTKYIWTVHPSDPHWGSFGNKEFIRDCENNRYLGVAEAVIEMMRRGGLCEEGKLPLHFLAEEDDPTQGNHPKIQQYHQPNPRKMPFVMIERMLTGNRAAATDADKKRCLELMDENNSLALTQFLLRGEPWSQDQMEEFFERHLEPNLDFFVALLARAKAAGIVVRGVSEFDGVPYDSRDIGLINLGTGNHFLSTVNREMAEGRINARVLRNMLMRFPQWSNQKELLEKLVKGPLYPPEFIGWGTIQAPGGYEWGIELRSEPTRLSDWGDPLLAWVRNDETRAPEHGMFSGRVALKVCGDKHFGCAVSTSHTLFRMALPGTHTDLYGQRGFPPNNTGVLFVGLPVDGPDGGPILDRMLRYDQLRDYFKNPYKFDWEEFLPNPA